MRRSQRRSRATRSIASDSFLSIDDDLAPFYAAAREDEVIIYRAFPEAAELAAEGEAVIAGAIRHAVKARRIYSAAVALAGVEEAFLRSGPVDEVSGRLTAIEGIGAWSAAFVLFRGLGRAERLLGSAMQEIYGRRRMPDGWWSRLRKNGDSWQSRGR
jgi:DNA-3-methyladenine glycosylase II